MVSVMNGLSFHLGLFSLLKYMFKQLFLLILISILSLLVVIPYNEKTTTKHSHAQTHFMQRNSHECMYVII